MAPWQIRSLFLIIALAAATPAFGRQSATSTAPDSQTSEHERLVKSLKSAVLRIRAHTASKEVFATGTGFLIDSDGHILTNFHVIQGALGAEIELPDSSTTDTKAVLVAVDPTLDLALLKVELSQKTPVSPLAIRSSPLIEGETVWAAGFPKSFGFTLSRGVVNGVRQYAELPETLRKQLQYSETSEWVQTDATINSGNSGGPLTDQHGKVVGMNTWVWLDGDNQFFALSAKHLLSMHARRSDKPVGFDDAARLYGTVKTVAYSFPSLQVSQRHDLRAAVRRADVFEKLVLCSTCSGVGSVTRDVKVGSRGTQGFSVPIWETKTSSCVSCARTGFGDPSRNYAGMSKLIEEVVQAKRDGDYQKHLETLVKRYGDTLSRAKGVPSVSMNVLLVKMNAKPEAYVGKPVWYSGKILDDIEIPSIGRQRVVQIAGESLIAVASDLQYADAVEGNTGFGFGYFAGNMQLKNGSLVPVVQGGVLLRVR